MRKLTFTNGEYYHIFNRGVDKRNVFMDDIDYQRFMKTLDLTNDLKSGLTQIHRDIKGVVSNSPEAKPQEVKKSDALVDIVAYCLVPNHYHFILRQKNDKGIEKFMQKLGTAYTMYFNRKYERSGSLFQGPFKAVFIDRNEYLLHLIPYINNNYFIHGYKNKEWKYSSQQEYSGSIKKDAVCSKKIILEQFGGGLELYKKFEKITSQHFKDKKDREKQLEF